MSLWSVRFCRAFPAHVLQRLVEGFQFHLWNKRGVRLSGNGMAFHVLKRGVGRMRLFLKACSVGKRYTDVSFQTLYDSQ